MAAGDGKDSLYRISPSTVTFRAALLPGWGQIINKAYWKVPVVWGGLGFMAYQTIQTADLYLTYRNAYRDRTDGNPGTVDPFVGKDSDASLIQKRDLLRRSRDAYVLLTLAAYALQILDAHVDAHLKAFDRLDFSLAPATPNAWAGHPGHFERLEDSYALTSSAESSAAFSTSALSSSAFSICGRQGREYPWVLSVRYRF
jgi:hypothetical protein